MSYCVMTVRLSGEHDVVLARQRARQIAAALQFDAQDQVRIATAVSEIARNAFMYGKGGKVEFWAISQPQRLEIRVIDQGPGMSQLKEVLDGQYRSQTGMGLGILGARRLMDEFAVETGAGAGTKVIMSKGVGSRAPAFTATSIGSISQELARNAPPTALGELQSQNQELLRTLQELEKRQAELAQLNRELEYTNRGVVALYAELDERADYLRRASELKTQFLSNMTHEFRTPLNSILSLARILLDRMDGELTPEQEKQVTFIQKAASDLSEIVNDLLDLAKVEAGKVTVRPGEFEIADLFGALRGMLRPLLAHNSSVGLYFDEPAGVPTVCTDQSKLSQVLRNLISNALKYTEQGEVRVRAWLETQEMLAVAVSDTGVGIGLADQDRIFEEFTQVEGMHQAGKRGTGLGLPLSRRLAELLGGTLTVMSEVGAGSTFILRVPVVYSGPTEVSVASEISTDLDPTRFPVLVVEDNRETLLIYERYLKGTCYQLIPARTVRQAREILKRCLPVAIVLDVLLSHENTWTFLSDLKSDPGMRRIPTFVVTLVENEQKARAYGADDFHGKPIDRQWLLRHLEKSVEGYQPEELLIIDDDPMARYVLSGLLKETRYRVLESATASEGLQVAEERRPAAVFLDLAMPDLDGTQALALLKSNPTTANIPVIIHTGKALNEEESNLLTQRAVAVLPKNHADRQLSLQRIRDVLAKAYAPTS
jgi:signal transduction histidine kinase/CheY-like chemotaxis protein